ncbi:MAG: hypothetical protein ACOYN5_10115 [Bacteroidales bacterium]
MKFISDTPKTYPFKSRILLNIMVEMQTSSQFTVGYQQSIIPMVHSGLALNSYYYFNV